MSDVNDTPEQPTIPKNSYEWSDGAIMTLKEMWDKGVSTREIASHLGTTKNSVVGKARRLKLTSRASPIRQKPPAKIVPVKIGTFDDFKLAEIDRGMCAFPVTPDNVKMSGHRFCGRAVAKRADGTSFSYCAEHAVRVYQPVVAKKVGPSELSNMPTSPGARSVDNRPKPPPNYRVGPKPQRH